MPPEIEEAAADAVVEAAPVVDPVDEANPDLSGDDAAAAAVEGEGEGAKPTPKPKKTAQERIDELTRERREAERDRDFYKEQALRGPQAQPAPVAQDTPQGDPRPTRADYDNDDDYIEDLTEWKADQAVERRFAQRSQNEQVRSTVENFESRAKTLYPDGEPAGLKAFKAIPELPVAVMEVVGASDIGPKLAEHLGDNPAELRRLAALSPTLQARELTLIETRLGAPSKPITKTATDAPEPPPQVRGNGGRFTVAPDTEDFAAFEKLADAKG